MADFSEQIEILLKARDLASKPIRDVTTAIAAQQATIATVSPRLQAMRAATAGVAIASAQAGKAVSRTTVAVGDLSTRTRTAVGTMRTARSGTDGWRIAISRLRNTMLLAAFTASLFTTAVSALTVVVGKKFAFAAANLTEAQNKVTRVFKESADAILTFAQTGPRALGQTEQQVLEAAGAFGAMFNALGISNDAIAAMSKRLVTLAADMASFNNQDPSDMLRRIQSGLAGEAEPLRRFGVFLTEARVKTKALALGLAETADEISESDKVLARYALILEDTKQQSGDYALTSDELINSSRTLRAALGDLAVIIGKELEPSWREMVSALSQWVQTDAPTYARKLGIAMNALTGFLRAFIPEFKSWVNAFRALPGEIQLTIVALTAWGIAGTKIIAMLVMMRNAVVALHVAMATNPWFLAAAAILITVGAMREFQRSTSDANDQLRTQKELLRSLQGLSMDDALRALELAQRKLEEARVKRMQAESAIDTAVKTHVGNVYELIARLSDAKKAEEEAGAAVAGRREELEQLDAVLSLNEGVLIERLAALKAEAERLNAVRDAMSDYHDAVRLGVQVTDNARRSFEMATLGIDNLNQSITITELELRILQGDLRDTAFEAGAAAAEFERLREAIEDSVKAKAGLTVKRLAEEYAVLSEMLNQGIIDVTEFQTRYAELKAEAFDAAAFQEFLTGIEENLTELTGLGFKEERVAKRVKTAIERAIESWEDFRTSLVADAFIRKGTKGVEALRKEFAKLDKEWYEEILPGLIALGVEVPEKFRVMMDRIRMETEEGAKRTITGLLAVLAARRMARGLDPGGGALQFAAGGVVPGPRGVPRLATVHGGERILPDDDMPTPGVLVEGNLYIGQGARTTVEEIAQGMDHAVRRGRLIDQVGR